MPGEYEDEEKVPILDKQNGAVPRESLAGTNVYKRRWWVLLLFSYASFVQAGIWNTWGPITESSEAVFGWKDSTIGMLANWGNIAYIISVLPFCWFMDVKGLRLAMLMSTFLMVLAAGVRCISFEPTAATWLCNICSILNGVAGSVPFAGPALLASVWFPLNQRATATAIASFFNYFGVAMAFVIGPQLVSDPIYADVSLENSTVITTESFILESSDNILHVINKDDVLSDIKRLMYIECGAAGLLFLCVVLYFPARPPLPPSITASIQRTEYGKGLKKLIQNGPVWLIVLAYAIPTGVQGVWSSVLDVNLNPIGVSQVDAGWLGFYGTLAGCAAGLITARFSDIFMRRMKLFLVILFIFATGAVVWFTILCNKYIPFDNVSLFASGILLCIFINGAIPLFYEISCEASYPVAEGVTGGFLTLVNNVFGILFLLILLIPGIGTTWMNWCLLGSVVIALPLLLIFPEKYRRTDIDITIVIPPPEEGIKTDIQDSEVDTSMEA